MNEKNTSKISFLGIAFSFFVLLSKTVAKASFDCEGSVGGCPPDLSDLQGIILRLLTIAISLIGLLVLFLIVKAGIQIMTSGGDQEKRAKGIKQLQVTVLGLLGIFLAYGLIVFAAKWLGVVDGPLSFVRGGQIIFDFILP